MSEEKTPRLCFDTYVGKNKHLKAEKRPFSSFPLHAHSFFELEIVVSGRGTQEINGKVYPLARGSVYLLTPSAFHKVTVDGENPTLINVSFDETAASVRLPIGESYLCRKLSGDEFAAVTSACELLLTESDQSAASLLLSYVIRKICGDTPNENPADPILKAAEHADFRFREKLTVADGAAVACLSPVYFGALFNERMGCSYTDYVNRRRVECASRLLLAGMTVAEACFASGFGSLSAFGAVFRSHTGCSPSEYRRKHKEK